MAKSILERAMEHFAECSEESELLKAMKWETIPGCITQLPDGTFVETRLLDSHE